MSGDADVILVGGRIFTSVPEHPFARALALRGERLVAVGTDAQAEAWSGRRTRTIDVRGRVVVPGFIDAHAHVSSAAGEVGWTDLFSSRTREIALSRLRGRTADAPPGAWVFGMNWDESQWPDRRYLDREDLDQVSTVHPVIAVRRDRHMAALNSRGLEAAGDLVGLRGFEVDGSGRPTGVVKEDAFGSLWDRLSPSEAAVEAGLGTMARRAHRLGITSIHDVVDLRGLRAYQRLHRLGRLRVRVYAMPRDDLLPHLASAGLMSGLGDSWLRLGAIKVFSDGSLGAYTAALSEDYEGRPGERGMLIHKPRELRERLLIAHRAGFQTATHAIGDEAIRVTLDALESVLAEVPRDDARHRIEHFELPDEDMIRRARAAGILASCQPNFIGWCSGPGGTYETRLGKDRASRNTPFQRIRRHRVPLCFGSDGMPYGPLYGLRWAVSGFFEHQRLPVEEAIRAYTSGGARASFEEDVKGTLAAGKLADFVVLRGDPFHDPVDIGSMSVDSTWIGGRHVYRRTAKR